MGDANGRDAELLRTVHRLLDRVATSGREEARALKLLRALAEEKLPKTRRLRARTADEEASDRLFQCAFHASLDPITLSDINGKFVEVNEAFCEQSGYGREEVLSRSVLDIGLWEDMDRRETFFAGLRRHGAVHAMEAVMRDRTGRRRHCLLSARITKLDGRPLVLTVTKDVTPLVEAEATLRTSEEFFRAALLASPNPATVSDTTGRFLEVNEAFCEMTGYAREEVIGRTPAQFRFWVEPEERLSYLQELRASGRAGEVVVRVRRKDGEVREIVLSSRVVELPGRRIVVTSSKDVTEQRRAQELLAESAAFFRSVVRAGVDPMTLADKGGALVEVNDAFVELTGINREAALGKRGTDLGLWAAPEENRAFVHQLTRTGRVRNMPARMRAKSGEVRDCLLSARTLSIGGNTLQLTTAKDMTELKRAEEQRRAGEKRFSAVVETAREGILVLDAGGVIRFANARMAELLAVPAEALAGLGPQDLSMPAHLGCLGPGGQAHANSQDVCLVRPGGTAVWAMLNASPLFAEDGSCEGIVGMFTDISRRKVMEEELIQARLRAEAADRAKSEFLASVSHEVRTPLTGVLGVARLLLSRQPRPDQVEDLSALLSSAETLFDIISDILDYSRLEARRMELSSVDFSPREVLERALRPLQHMAEEKGVGLHLRVAKKVPHQLAGDPLRIGQVVRNLAHNAVKFTPPGGAVTVELDTPDKARPQRVRLAVRDTGVGIPAERHADIFQSFVQLLAPAEGGGTGLGLAICQRLVTAMGGDIALASAPGKGSTFTVTLPLAPATGRQHEEERPQPDELAGLSGKRILLAEDNPVNRRVVGSVLEDRGLDVTLAADGGEALRLLSRGGFDCALLDLRMPKLQGIEVARRIRQGQAPGVAPDLPLVALTAYAFDENSHEALMAGMDAHLAKPVDEDRLLMVLAALLCRGDRALARRLSGQPSDEEDAPPERDLQPERLVRRFAASPELLPEIMDLFLRDARAAGEQVRTLAADGPSAALADRLHALGGQASVVLALGLQKQALAMERAVRAGMLDEEGLGLLLLRLDAVLADAEAFLRRL